MIVHSHPAGWQRSIHPPLYKRNKVDNLQRLLSKQNGDIDSQFIGNSSELELGVSEKRETKPSEKKRRISYL